MPPERLRTANNGSSRHRTRRSPITRYAKILKRISLEAKIGYRMSPLSAMELALSLSGHRPREVAEKYVFVDGRLQRVRIFEPGQQQLEPDFHRRAMSRKWTWNYAR